MPRDLQGLCTFDEVIITLPYPFSIHHMRLSSKFVQENQETPSQSFSYPPLDHPNLTHHSPNLACCNPLYIHNITPLLDSQKDNQEPLLYDTASANLHQEPLQNANQNSS